MYRSTCGCGLAILAISGGWISSASAATERVLYSLPANAYAFDRVLEDNKDHLFATTYSAGVFGSVIELTNQGQFWEPTTLWQFQGSDGQNPIGGVLDDNNDVLFGTTLAGGSHGDGTIYAIPPGGGRTVVYNFTGGHDGYEPESTLIRDKATGTFYGTTSLGGDSNCGTVFQFAPSGSSWTFSTLYDLKGGPDGCFPERSLHFGNRSGLLYGSTLRGGGFNRGTIFSLSEKTGVWKESVIYSFTGGTDGSEPTDLAVDTDGTIFGVAERGGSLRQGAIFHLAPVDHVWHESVIYNFQGGADGAKPIGLHLNQIAGVLYGTTERGGTFKKGTVFSLTPNGSGWTEIVLHAFGAAGDGVQPRARVTQDNKKAVLYGTTVYGGQFNGGTIYEIKL